MGLLWESEYEIILALKASYPSIVVDSVGLYQLYQMIISLPEFGDDPHDVEENILQSILVGWYEEVNS
ncbi:MAG: Fe-S cluster assembly protein IscX [Phototrophicaceae bacterium]